MEPLLRESGPAAEQASTRSSEVTATGFGHCRRLPPPRRLLGESAVGLAAAGLASVAGQAAMARLRVPMPSYLTTAVAAAGGVVVVAGLLAVVLAERRRARWWTVPTGCSALSALATLALALPLQGTRFYLGGISVDQQFRTQYLTRMASSPALTDMNYPDLPAYYPAGWFWVGGRLADLAGLPAWVLYKPLAILTVALAGALAFLLWTCVTSRATALLLGTATTLVGLRAGALEPYGWLLVASVAPVTVIALHGLRCGLPRTGQHRRGGTHRVALAGVGGFVGLCAAVYALYAGITGLLLVALAAAVLASARPAWRAAAGPVVARLAGVGVVALLVGLPLWLPYLLAAVPAGLPGGAALRYLPLESAALPLPMLEASGFGALCLAGMVWLVLRGRRDELAGALAVTVLGGYGWYLLSTLALTLGFTLLAFRVEPLLDTALACAGVLGVRAALARAREGLGSRHHRAALAVVLLVAALGAVSVVQSVGRMHPTELRRAYVDYYPSGVTATGASDPSRDGAWNDELIAAIAELSGRPADDLVVLTVHHPLMAFEPYRGYQQSTPHYANPLAHFDARNAEIARWSRAGDATDLLAKMDSGPYRPPEVFVLRRAAGGWRMTLARDAFPAQPNVAVSDVLFADRLFDQAQFQRRQVGPFLVAVRR